MVYWDTCQTLLPSKLTQPKCLVKVLKKAQSGIGSLWTWRLLAPEEKLAVACCQNSVYYGAWGKLGVGGKMALAWVRLLCHKKVMVNIGSGEKVCSSLSQTFVLHRAIDVLDPERQMALIWVRLPFSHQHGKCWVRVVSLLWHVSDFCIMNGVGNVGFRA